jgi:PAS domain S-box/diguanylate cyclase (GGDEF) domain
MARIRQATLNAIAAAVLTATMLVLVVGANTIRKNTERERAEEDRERITLALGDDMYKASDYLTDEVRSFVATGERAHLDAYWAEVENARRRDAALAEASLLAEGGAEVDSLALAKKRSDDLVVIEARAMRLEAEALGYSESQMPARVAALALDAKERALAPAEKTALARSLVFGQSYWESKRGIRAAISGYVAQAQGRAAKTARAAESAADRANAVVMVICAIGFLCGGCIILAYYRLLALPVRQYIARLRTHDPESGYPPLEPRGCAELYELGSIINLRRTQRMRAEREAKDTEIKLRTNLFMMPIGAMEIDQDNHIMSWNPAAERIFGFTSEEAIGMDVMRIVPERLRADIGAVIERLRNGEVIDSHENANMRKDGTEIICEWLNTPLFDSTGAKIGWASLVKDVTKERAEATEILYLSRHDPLTGLLNRRSMQEKLDEESLRCRRTGGLYATIMLDIDRFKRFNDQHGHECGDEVLKSVAEVMRSSVRATDSVGRWGGEEFLILLPETGVSGGQELAEKIRKRIEESEFSYRSARLSITVTSGVAACVDPEENVDDCIKRADEALLQGKEGGRNRVVTA